MQRTLNMSSVLKMLPLVCGLLLLSSCTTTRTTGTTAAKDACLAWPFTPYSASGDTTETITGNRKNNAAREAFCG